MLPVRIGATEIDTLCGWYLQLAAAYGAVKNEQSFSQLLFAYGLRISCRNGFRGNGGRSLPFPAAQHHSPAIRRPQTADRGWMLTADRSITAPVFPESVRRGHFLRQKEKGNGRHRKITFFLLCSMKNRYFQREFPKMDRLSAVRTIPFRYADFSLSY